MKKQKIESNNKLNSDIVIKLHSIFIMKTSIIPWTNGLLPDLQLKNSKVKIIKNYQFNQKRQKVEMKAI